MKPGRAGLPVQPLVDDVLKLRAFFVPHPHTGDLTPIQISGIMLTLAGTIT